jgi:hypothetical protein
MLIQLFAHYIEILVVSFVPVTDDLNTATINLMQDLCIE